MMESQTIRRVLMTTDTVGGVWNYSLQFAQQLREFGVEVVLATMGAPLRPDQRADADHLSNVALLESNYRLEWMVDPWNDIEHAGEWLLDVDKHFKPDIVHLNQYCFASLPWKSPVVVVGHSCVSSWWEAVRPSQPLDARFSKYCDVVKDALEAADCVVTPSHAMLKALHRCYRAKVRDAVVIPNGRSRNGGPPLQKEPIIFCAGRIWDEAKNIAAVMQIADQLSFPVYLAGDITGMSAPSRKNLHYLGLLSSREMECWMHRASIYLSPARYEPFALCVLEAAIARCALVLGDIESLRENWNDAALFVDPSVPEQIAETVEQLVRDPELMADFAGRAYQKSLMFTPERMVFRYLKLYEHLRQKARGRDAARSVTTQPQSPPRC
jgi:glycogen synthase